MKPNNFFSAIVIAVVVLNGLFLSSCNQNSGKNQTLESEPNASEYENTPDTIALSAKLPFDVTIKGSVMETTVRRSFDTFSWESFVALNWSQDSTKVIGIDGDNATIWETWKNSGDVFLPDGAQPSPWGDPDKIPAVCKTNEGKFLVMVGKTPDVLNELELPFKTGPLIDQNGNYSRFEILINQEMFEYIDENTLYSFDGQQAFNKPAAFPEGNNDSKQWGAIMVKGAWKVLDENDDPSRFHTVEAIVYTPAQENPKINESCFKAKVGLVGLHIGTKTKISPQWIWSTFEQVDNVPTFGEAIDKEHYNYFDASTDREINEAPARPWNPNIPDQIPTQVKRLTPIDAGTAALNAAYQGRLRSVNPKSVWQYYELVGTQWPVNPKKLPLGDPFPQFLGNATLETYILGIIKNDSVELVPNVTTSCMHCHNGATMIATGKASDFTFLLERAN
jgi:hypothetical protein